MAVLRNDLLLRAARRERTERTPVWMMRQAGRADPEYRALRERSGLPLESLFRSPDRAAQISRLPKRLGGDASIFFQDILTPLAPMGAEFVFRPGPILDTPIRTASDVDRLKGFDPSEALGFVGEILRKVRRELDGELPLLGFAGAPLTLAMFLAKGTSPAGDVSHTQSMMRDDPDTLHRLLEKLADMTADYLLYQIESGADAVQLFDSFADLVSPDQYAEFAHPYHVRIFSKIAGRAPTILFCREQPNVELMADSGADVLSVGRCVDLADAKKRLGDRVALQGNVDHELLLNGSGEQIDQAVSQCIAAGGGQGHILNLCHGVLPKTPFDNVRRFVDAAKSLTTADASATSP